MNAGGDQAGDIGESIAALTSKRTNLSPFTKGCRDRGASMRIIYNFFRGSAPTTMNLMFIMILDHNKSILYHRSYMNGHGAHPGITSSGNLPGWRWARIKQLALVGLSSSRHSEVCNALGCTFGAAHSIISVHGNSRPRGCQQYIYIFWGIFRLWQ